MLSNTKRSIQQLCSAACLLLALSACGGGARPFVAIDATKPIKPSRLAVIAGETDDVGKHIAEAVTEQLQSRTSFQVMSQKDVAKKIGKYPFPVKMAHLPEGNPSVWLFTEEAELMKQLQAKLKVDYIYVVWGRNLQQYVIHSGNSSSQYYSLSVFGNLLEYPSAKAVAFTDFSYQRKVKFYEALAFKKSSYYVDSLLKLSAEYLVDNFIKVTKAGKGK